MNVPVLDLENEESNALLAIEDEIQRSITNDKVEAIVLGCAGMADFAENWKRNFLFQ